jgi:hypothetical protein
MQFSQINFEPLNQTDHLMNGPLRATFRNPLTIGLLILLVPTYFLPASLRSFAFIIIITILFVILGRNQAKVINSAWRQFAQINNWTIKPSDMNQVPPGLLNVGSGQKVSSIINAKFDNLNCDLFSYEYDVHAGKAAITYVFMIARIQLDKTFPHIVLDGQRNIKGLRTLPGYEQLKLEGNFNKYFKLYVQKGEEIDALSIIAPNVMQTLIDSNRQQDIEVYGNSLYFINVNGSSIRMDANDIKSLFESVEKLSGEIILRSKSLSYNPASKA